MRKRLRAIQVFLFFLVLVVADALIGLGVSGLGLRGVPGMVTSWGLAFLFDAFAAACMFLGK